MLNKDLNKNALEELKRTQSRYDSQLKSTIRIKEKFCDSKLAAQHVVQGVAKHLAALTGNPKEYAKEVSEIKVNLLDFATVAKFWECGLNNIGVGGSRPVKVAGKILLATVVPLSLTIGGGALLGSTLWESTKNKKDAKEYENISVEVERVTSDLKKLETFLEKKNIELKSLVQRLEEYDSAFEWVKEKVENFSNSLGSETTKEKTMGYKRFERLSSIEKDNLKSIINLTKAISEVLKEEINKG